MKYKLTSTLCITLSGDSLITVSLIWLIIHFGGDTRILGMVLFINTLLPFLGQKIFNKNCLNTNLNPNQKFIQTRIIGAIFSLILAVIFVFYNKNIILYMSASIFTIINFFSNQYLEAIFGTMVFKKFMDANTAARIQQTSLQLSVLLGSTLVGFIINYHGFLGILLVNILTYIYGAIGMLYNDNLAFLKDKIPIKDINITPKNVESFNYINIENCFFILTILAIVLYSFNFLLPFLSQLDKKWSAIQFGIIDALGAVGAFTSVLAVGKIMSSTFFYKISYFILILSLFSFFFIKQPIQAIGLSFLFGFSLNCLRIKMRERILNAVTSTQMALKYGRNITAINMLTRSLIPLSLGFIISKVSASYLFLNLSILCTIFFILSFLISFQQSIKSYNGNL